jgi:hypothetical protein
MCNSQDKNQHTHIVAETGYQLFQILNLLPETKLHKSVSDIKKIVGDKQDIIEVVGCCCIVFHKG